MTEESDIKLKQKEQLSKEKYQDKRGQNTRKDRWREKKKMEKREVGEDIGRHGGGELSEHPILEERGLGVGEDGEEIVRRHGRWSVVSKIKGIKVLIHKGRRRLKGKHYRFKELEQGSKGPGVSHYTRQS